MTSRPSRRLSSTAVLLALPLLLAPLGGGGCMVTTTAATPGTYGASGGLEYDHDRAGSDYRSFDLPEPRPDLCLSYCQNEAQCLAFTYVKPGIQGPAPRCWLKSAIPPATANACCVSGVVRSQPAQAAAPPPPPPPGPTGGAYETDYDRGGSDYRSFDLPEPRPELCRGTCEREAQCLAFTYVKPGVQGPAPRCWLKSSVPPPRPNGCCVSGVK
jgi:hypothetical protein